jgi:3,4-dihydroxy 2-butanone 4-phosphate synthase/GTP cyclohydrolase II
MTARFADMPTAIRVIAEGGMVVVMDDEDRENEGDIIMAAECVTAKQCALTIRHTTGILCAPMTAKRAEELALPRMVQTNEDPNGTAFTITCDSIKTTTGVSAKDRTQTFRDLADSSCGSTAFSRPGHIFPLIARPGGVLERRGHTEAGVDLCIMAGKAPVAFIAELCNDDGTMMRLDDCAKFADSNNLPLITVEAMVKYLGDRINQVPAGAGATQVPLSPASVSSPEIVGNAANGQPTSPKKQVVALESSPPTSNPILDMVSPLVGCCQQHMTWPEAKVDSLVAIGGDIDFVASTTLPTARGDFSVFAYRNRRTNAEPIVFMAGKIDSEAASTEDVPVRVHDQCLTSEVFSSLRCDCKQQLMLALDHIRTSKSGLVLYLPQEGRGIGLANKVAAYSLQERGFDTVDANREMGLPDDARSYECVAPILAHLGVKSITLLTNNPQKVDQLKKAGVEVTKRIPCEVPADQLSDQARQYVQTKLTRMGHMSS